MTRDVMLLRRDVGAPMQRPLVYLGRELSQPAPLTINLGGIEVRPVGIARWSSAHVWFTLHEADLAALMLADVAFVYDAGPGLAIPHHSIDLGTPHDRDA